MSAVSVLEGAVYCFCTYFIVVVGSTANSISLSYFLRQDRASVSTFIFTLNNSLDLLICLLITPVLLTTSSSSSSPFLFSSSWFCSSWNHLYAVAMRMSMFTTAVLCVTRTASLVQPLRKVKIRHVLWSLVMYLITVVVTRALTVSQVVYNPEHLICQARYDATKFTVDTLTVMAIVKILVPTVPSVAGCLITIAHLRRSGRLARTVGRVKQDAMWTVVILTLVFLFFCTPHFIFLVFKIACYQAHPGVLCGQYLFTTWLHNLTCFYIPTLNASINPLVYLIRIQKIREYSVRILRCRRPVSADNSNVSIQERSNVNNVVVRSRPPGVPDDQVSDDL